MVFTSEQAYEASEAGRPIMVDFPAVLRICRDHGCRIDDAYSNSAGEFVEEFGSSNAPIDAVRLLEWLGY